MRGRFAFGRYIIIRRTSTADISGCRPEPFDIVTFAFEFFQLPTVQYITMAILTVVGG